MAWLARYRRLVAWATPMARWGIAVRHRSGRSQHPRQRGYHRNDKTDYPLCTLPLPLGAGTFPLAKVYQIAQRLPTVAPGCCLIGGRSRARRWQWASAGCPNAQCTRCFSYYAWMQQRVRRAIGGAARANARYEWEATPAAEPSSTGSTVPGPRISSSRCINSGQNCTPGCASLGARRASQLPLRTSSS